MSQIIINTGNIANDGTGDPLRTAFNDVNNNFTQVFTAGPVGSNIAITNNTIQVTNTNGNLRLATNGVGVIVPAANFVPDIPGARSIGAATNRFNTIYAQYLNATTGTYSGNVYISGNLNVVGNTITNNYSNANIANLTLTLAGGSSNAILANGAGIIIDSAEASFVYNYSANSWNSPIGITAPTFIGDGSQLTNVNAVVDANTLIGNTLSSTVVFSNLTSFGSVTGISATGNISTTGNVYANVIIGNVINGNFVGDGSSLTNLTANAIIGNVPYALNANAAYTANLAALATQAINADTALFAINANLAAFANVATSAQTANTASYSVQSDNANSAVVAGMAYQLSPTANISVTGNITTSEYFIGNGSQLTGIVAVSDYGNANVAEFLPTYTGNIGANVVTANYLAGDGSNITSIPASGTTGYVQINSQGLLSTYGGTPYDTYSTLSFDGSGLVNINGTSAFAQDNNMPYITVNTPKVQSEDYGIIAGPAIQVVGYDDNYNTPRSAFLSLIDRADATQQWDFGILGYGSNNFTLNNSTGNSAWVFGTDGNLTLPSNVASINYANGDPYGGYPSGNSGAVQINWLGAFSNQGGTPGDTYSTLQFDSNGIPTLDGTTAYQQRVDYSPYLQVLAPRVESTDFGIVAGPAIQITGYADEVFYNTPRSAYLSVQDQATATQQWDFGILGNGSNNYSITDRTNGNVWTFGTDGNITLPSNIASINYANGDPYGGGGGNANTGNVTFDNQVVVGTGDDAGAGGLYLAPGNTSVGNLQYLRVRGGDYPTHIHFDTGNNQYFDQYLGDDYKYVKLSNTGSITINSNDYIGNSAQWSFGTDGSTIFPNATLYDDITGTTLSTANSLNLASPSAVTLESGGGLGQLNLIQDDANNTGRLEIIFQNGMPGQIWTFDETGGNLTLPNDTVIGNAVSQTTQGPAVNSFGSDSYTGTFTTLDYASLDTTWTVNGPGVVNGTIQAIDAAGQTIILTRSVGSPQFQNGQSYTFSGPLVSVGTKITVNSNNWLFGTDGTLTTPGGSGVVGGFIFGAPGEGAGVSNGGTGYQQFFVQGDGAFVQTSVDNAGTVFNTWTFGLDGKLTFPADGGVLGNTGISFESAVDGNTSGLYTTGNITEGGNTYLYATNKVYVRANNNGTTQDWTFGADGNLTLPDIANPSINYANGQPYGGSGSSAAAGNAGDIPINVAGNIGADSSLRYVDSGGEMTLYADYMNTSTVFTNDILGSGNDITITAQFGNTVTFDTTGGITTLGNVTANIFHLANAGANTTSVIQRNQNPPYGSEQYGIELLTTTDDANVFSSISAGPDYVTLQSTNAGNANVIAQGGYGVTISTSNATGAAIKEWSFVSSGDAYFPGSLDTDGNVLSQGQVSAIGNITTDGYFIGTFIGNVTGNFVVPGANTQVLFNTNGNADAKAGMTFVDGPNLFTVLGNVQAKNLIGNLSNGGSKISVANNGNITVGVGSFGTTYVTIAPALLSVTGNIITSGNITAVGNVTAGNILANNIGNVATLNLNGNGNTVLYGNGVFAAVTGGNGNASTGNVTFDNINIIGTGNLHLQPDPANSSAYLDIFLTGGAGPDIHIAGNGENVIIGRDAGANVLVAVDGTVSIQADAGTPYTWTFGYDSNLTIPGAILTNSNSQLELTESANTAYLGTTADDSTALYLTATAAQLYANGEVSISSNVGGGNIHGWAFDVDGNTNIPGDIISFGNIGITANVGGTLKSWAFDSAGNLTTPQGGYIGSADAKGQGTMLSGGTGNLTSVTSYYADAPGIYSSCVTATPDGIVDITTYGNGTGQLGQWSFQGANLLLAPQNISNVAGESAILAGTRKIINGQYSGASYGYSAVLATGGTPTVAYTATNEYVQSVRLTFAVESVGTASQWEQFDIVATKSLDTPGTVNFVVSNRIKGRASISDTTVTATINGSNEIEISLNLDAGQTSGWSSFDAVEFGVMFN